MRLFCTQYLLTLKQRLKSPSYLLMCLFLAAVVSFAAWMVPKETPSPLEVGVCLEDSELGGKFVRLLTREDSELSVTCYPAQQLEEMRQAVRQGQLIAGYALAEDFDEKLLSLENEALVRCYTGAEPSSASAANEVVASVLMELRSPILAAGFLTRQGQAGPQTLADSTRLVEDILANGALIQPVVLTDTPASTQTATVFPTLYALLLSLCFVSALSPVLFIPRSEGVRLKLAGLISGHPAILALATACGRVSTDLALFLCCDAAMTFFAGENPFPLAGRLLCAAGMALLCWALSLVFGKTERLRRIAVYLLPVWILFNLLYSGALIDPARLGAAGLLRWLCPVWYLLKIAALG